MRSFLIKAVGLPAVAVLLAAAGPRLPADAPKDVQAELKKLQGLWQHIPGGMHHLNGGQVVRGPDREGPNFFIQGDKLIWLDKEGKPSGGEETVTLDPTADPKRIKFTTGQGDKKQVLREGIYSCSPVREGETAADSLTIHVALEGRPVPKRFLEFNKPVEGVDGHEWLVGRCKIQVK